MMVTKECFQCITLPHSV
uniref:Uncharacterized protein n=1 Tax=Rhizophora mucronata TaxID=61149 RepID=A0A2P2R4W7_RHIMU